MVPGVGRKVGPFFFARICITFFIFAENYRTMAKPIAETPVLYDEDAYRFEMAAHNVKPLPKTAQRELQRAYEKFKRIANFHNGI